MRRPAAPPIALICALLSAWGGPSAPAQREGRLEGTIEVTPSSRRDAWVFLYPPEHMQRLAAGAM